MTKPKRRGPKPTVKHPGYHTVYLDRETWKRLMKYQGGASKAIRDQETRIHDMGVIFSEVRTMLESDDDACRILSYMDAEGV